MMTGTVVEVDPAVAPAVPAFPVVFASILGRTGSLLDRDEGSDSIAGAAEYVRFIVCCCDKLISEGGGKGGVNGE